MVKRIHHILNLIIGTCLGIFVGSGIYSFWDFRMHPELYHMQSAPWYTGILLRGTVTVAVIVGCLILKAILRMIEKKKRGGNGFETDHRTSGKKV